MRTTDFNHGDHVRSPNLVGIGLWFIRTALPDRAVVVAIGDDMEREVDLDSLSKLEEEDFCGGCGQIGCGAYE